MLYTHTTFNNFFLNGSATAHDVICLLQQLGAKKRTLILDKFVGVLA